jgi:dolichol-phosphate mannosyltransferase
MQAIIVIPTYNERENLEQLVEKIQCYANDLHILIVDDNSPDGTGELADELSRKYPGKLFVLHREKKEGLGRAYVAGFKHVLKKDYEIILQMDADLSHNPSHIPSFLKQIRDCDLVLGSRYLHGISVVNWDFKRLILSKVASKYVRFITGMPFTDTTGGFKCWRREALESVGLEDLFSIGYLFIVETTYKAYRKGFKVSEVPIIFIERDLGQSKISWAIIWESFWGVLKLKLKY